MANIALPIQSQNKQGNVHINEEHQQIRAQVDTEGPSAWFHPISSYRAGKTILRGQPVSIAFEDELPLDAKISGEPCVVPTDPHKHNWCIGVALEPGTPDSNPDPVLDNSNHVHVLANGKLKFAKDETRLNCFNPPTYRDSQGRTQFVWTYNDIGKSVYVSNAPGKEGQLTIDVTEAYANGANIITVGHLADAPTAIDATHPDPHGNEIVIEVQLDGDNRGLIDSTEFSLTLLDRDPTNNPVPAGPQNTGSNDRLICVKVIYDSTTSTYKGKMILDNATLLEGGGQQSPIGAFLAEPGIDYCGKSVVVYRLGIVEGHAGAPFTWTFSDYGKDIFLSNGNLTTMGSDAAYEYKVGVVISSNRVLVDCRYARTFQKFEMIGKIKPLYDGANTDPGYMIVNPSDVHKVSDYYNAAANVGLLTVILYQDIATFYSDANGTIAIPRQDYINMSAAQFSQAYPNASFKFKEMLYEFGPQTAPAARTQIKYSTEGSPDNLSYAWPSKVFEARLTATSSGPHAIDSPVVKLDITDLVKAGETIGGGTSSATGNIIVDDYWATVFLKGVETSSSTFEEKNVQVSSGYYTVNKTRTETYQTTQTDASGNPIEETIERNDPYLCGYEWAIKKEQTDYLNPSTGVTSTLTNYYLCMITNPGGLSPEPPAGTYPNQNNPISVNNVLGFCYPPGVPITSTLEIVIIVRRRPTFYHDLMLNQLYSDPSWRGSLLFDGSNLGVNSSIYFDHVVPGNADPSGNGYLAYIDTTYSNSMTIKDQGTDPNDPSFNNGNLKYKIFEIVYGKTTDGNTPSTDTQVNQAVERHIRTAVPASATQSNYIDWRYDFDDVSVETNATMAARFFFPNTQSNTAGTNMNPPIPFKAKREQQYVADELTTGTPGGFTASTVPRRALKTLHEIPIEIFEYYEFLGTNIIGTPQGAFFPIGTGAGLEHGTDKDILRPLFSGITDANKNDIDSIYYTYDSNASATGITDYKEWNLIQQELDYVFNIRGDATGSSYWRNDQQIQSNVGLLNRAAKETQDRLLKIERSIFGGDAPEIPKHYIKVQGVYNAFNNNQLDYLSSQTTAGVLRLMKFMVNNDIVFFVTPSTAVPTGINTYYPDLYYEVFGDYKAYEEGGTPRSLWRYEMGNVNIPTPKNSLTTGKVHYMWLFTKWHEQDIIPRDVTTGLANIPNGGNGYMPEYVPFGMHSAQNIYIGKTVKAYQDKFISTYPTAKDSNAQGYEWPLSSVNWAEAPTLIFGTKNCAEFFYDNIEIGFSDYSPPSKSAAGTDIPAGESSFASKSVEGYLVDILLKLSYIRGCFNKATRSIDQEYSMMTSIKKTYKGPATVQITSSGIILNNTNPKTTTGMSRALRPAQYKNNSYEGIQHFMPDVDDQYTFTAIQLDSLREYQDSYWTGPPTQDNPVPIWINNTVQNKITRFGVAIPKIVEDSATQIIPTSIYEDFTMRDFPIKATVLFNNIEVEEQVIPQGLIGTKYRYIETPAIETKTLYGYITGSGRYVIFTAGMSSEYIVNIVFTSAIMRLYKEEEVIKDFELDLESSLVDIPKKFFEGLTDEDGNDITTKIPLKESDLLAHDDKLGQDVQIITGILATPVDVQVTNIDSNGGGVVDFSNFEYEDTKTDQPISLFGGSSVGVDINNILVNFPVDTSYSVQLIPGVLKSYTNWPTGTYHIKSSTNSDTLTITVNPTTPILSNPYTGTVTIPIGSIGNGNIRNIAEISVTIDMVSGTGTIAANSIDCYDPNAAIQNGHYFNVEDIVLESTFFTTIVGGSRPYSTNAKPYLRDELFDDLALITKTTNTPPDDADSGINVEYPYDDEDYPVVIKSLPIVKEFTNLLVPIDVTIPLSSLNRSQTYSVPNSSRIYNADMVVDVEAFSTSSNPLWRPWGNTADSGEINTRYLKPAFLKSPKQKYKYLYRMTLSGIQYSFPLPLDRMTKYSIEICSAEQSIRLLKRLGDGTSQYDLNGNYAPLHLENKAYFEHDPVLISEYNPLKMDDNSYKVLIKNNTINEQIDTSSEYGSLTNIIPLNSTTNIGTIFNNEVVGARFAMLCNGLVISNSGSKPPSINLIPNGSAGKYTVTLHMKYENQTMIVHSRDFYAMQGRISVSNTYLKWTKDYQPPKDWSGAGYDTNYFGYNTSQLNTGSPSGISSYIKTVALDMLTSPTKPELIPTPYSSITYRQAMMKLDEIIAYCSANPLVQSFQTTKNTAEGYKTTYGDPDDWPTNRSTACANINNGLIPSLTAYTHQMNTTVTVTYYLNNSAFSISCNLDDMGSYTTGINNYNPIPVTTTIEPKEWPNGEDSRTNLPAPNNNDMKSRSIRGRITTEYWDIVMYMNNHIGNNANANPRLFLIFGMRKQNATGINKVETINVAFNYSLLNYSTDSSYSKPYTESYSITLEASDVLNGDVSRISDPIIKFEKEEIQGSSPKEYQAKMTITPGDVISPAGTYSIIWTYNDSNKPPTGFDMNDPSSSYSWMNTTYNGSVIVPHPTDPNQGIVTVSAAITTTDAGYIRSYVATGTYVFDF